MTVGTTLSRATGIARTFALAYALGSLALADAYNLANTLPNIMNDLVLGGIVSATFIPVFVERLSTRSEEEAWDAISAVTSVTFLLLAAATAAFFALTPLVIAATTALNHSAHAAQTRHVATDLLFLFVPQLACYGFISLATALLNARRQFGAPMFAPIANNVVLIAVLLVFGTIVRQRSVSGVAAHRGQLLLLGLGTTLGVAAQAGLMVPSLRRAGLRLRWKPDFRHEAVRRILRLSGWTFGLVVAEPAGAPGRARDVREGGTRRRECLHLRLHVLPAPLRDRCRVDHGGHRSGVDPPLGDGRLRCFQPPHGRGPEGDAGGDHPRRGWPARSRATSRRALPGPRSQHRLEHRSHCQLTGDAHAAGYRASVCSSTR